MEVGRFFSLPQISASETNDATAVRDLREATMKWMGCPVIIEQRRAQFIACLHASLFAFIPMCSSSACSLSVCLSFVSVSECQNKARQNCNMTVNE